jgi:hypothetical protein
LAIWGAAVAAALLWWRCRGRPEQGWIVSLAAIDADSAVVVWRANYDEGPSRSWVGRVDGNGRTTWVRQLPDLAFSVGPGNGLIVAGDVVAVRYGHHEGYKAIDHAVAAFALRDGRPLWDVTLTPDHGQFESGLPLYHSALVTDHGRIAVWAAAGGSATLFVLDAATGAVVSRLPAAGDSYAAVAFGTRIVTHHVNETTIFDTAGGAPPHHLDTTYEGCTIGEDYVAIEDDALVAYHGADPTARRVIAAPFRPIPEVWSRLRRCGRYRDRLVLLIETSRRELRDDRTFVVIADAAGQVLHAIDLGRDMLSDGPSSVAKRDPRRAPLGGELTRFAPYVQRTYEDGTSTTRLIMLDLERGVIAWAGPRDDDLIHMSLFRGGDRWYAHWPYLSRILATFDGNTGELAAAARLHDHRGIADVQPAHVAGGRVWVAGGAWTTFGAAQIAVLDAATLAPTFARGVEVTDLTAVMREALRPAE